MQNQVLMLKHLAPVTQLYQWIHFSSSIEFSRTQHGGISSWIRNLSKTEEVLTEIFKKLHVHCSFLCANAQTHSPFSPQFGSNSGFLADTQIGAHEASNV